MSELFKYSQTVWPADHELIERLHERGYRTEGERFQNGFDRYVRATLIEAHKNAGPKSRLWIAWRDLEPVGCCAMIDRYGIGQVRWLVVVPEARGHAVGKHLIETAISYARGQSWKGVYLETTDQLEASMSIYLKAGFAVTRSEQTTLWNGQGHLIRMYMDLSP